MISFVLPFDSSDATLAEVGGKGANLSHMTRAGFPVPSDFLITTTAYRAVVEVNNLQTQTTSRSHRFVQGIEARFSWLPSPT